MRTVMHPLADAHNNMRSRASGRIRIYILVSVVILVPPLFSFQGILAPLLPPTRTWTNQTEDADHQNNHHHHLMTQNSDSSSRTDSKAAADVATIKKKNRTNSKLLLADVSSFVTATMMESNEAATVEVGTVAIRQESPVVPPIHGRAIFETCQANLIGHVSRIQQQHYIRNPFHGQPILQSMVPVDGTYRMIFITEHIKHLYASWTSTISSNNTTNNNSNRTEAQWTCDGTPALLHPKQHENNVGEGGTFVLTCPITVQMVTGIQGDVDGHAGHGAGSRRTVHYNTSVWRSCADDNPLQGIPTNSTHKVVCTMIAGHHWELTQWMEYHRLIGFQHFLIYLNEPYEPETLPNATDITYIPWNFTRLGDKGAIPHQAVQQMDCIQRAQARNVTWLALLDVDEYFQIMTKINPNNNNSTNEEGTTLDEILKSHEIDPQMGGLQIPSWFFGENIHDENHRTISTTTPTALNVDSVQTQHSQLMIDSVWRGRFSYGQGRPAAGREKMIVRPRQVVYFACHKIVVGGPMKAEPRIRMNHYKTREKGVYPNSLPSQIVRDESFRDTYGPILRKRLGLEDVATATHTP